MAQEIVSRRVSGTDVDGLLTEYWELRAQAEEARQRASHSPELLAMIREEVGEVVAGMLGPVEVEATGYSRERVEAKLLGLVAVLQDRFPEFVSPAELKATERFVEMAFGCYEHGRGEGAGDSYAFLVSIRASDGSAEYGNELVPYVPALHYVPTRLRAIMIMGVPPYIIDTYTVNGSFPGYLVCCPVYGDVAAGLSRHEFIRSSRLEVQRTADFAASKLHARFLGLGGVLPSLTRYGKTIKTPGVVVTTGHAGTISLVLGYVERAVAASPEGVSIGVLGLGSIGRSIAAAVARKFSGLPIGAFDIDERQSERFISSLDQAADVTIFESTAELIDRSDIVVSAVTTRIDAAELTGADPAVERQPLAGKLIIDDSQPFAFAPQLVHDLGGDLTWVVARVGPMARRSWFDYATMADRHADFFGCEAEVTVLAAEYCAQIADGVSADMAFEQVGAYAVHGPATLDHVASISELFRSHGVSIAPHQTFAAREWPAGPAEVVDLRDGPMSSAPRPISDLGVGL